MNYIHKPFLFIEQTTWEDIYLGVWKCVCRIKLYLGQTKLNEQQSVLIKRLMMMIVQVVRLSEPVEFTDPLSALPVLPAIEPMVPCCAAPPP